MRYLHQRMTSAAASRGYLQLAALCSALAMAAAGCGDSTQNQPTGAGGADGITQDSAINLGDTKTDSKGDTAIVDIKDTAPSGCISDDECAGKVSNLLVCEKAVCDLTTGQCQAGDATDGEACDDGNLCWTERSCSAGKCGGGKPKSCDDSNPCTDNLCDKTKGCVATPNTAPCDDGDNCTADDLCDAGSCKAGKNTCNPTGTETDCKNGADDDKDGLFDCNDNDCANDAACTTLPSEKLCADGKDDDSDGKVDCLDSDCAADAACLKPTSEGDCKDGKDDDGDGAADCADNDCATDPACALAIKEANCADQIDDDKDGKIDCDDSDCAADAACKAAKELDCVNGKDDDLDGSTDCKDNDCSLAPPCAVTVTVEANCTDGKDDDLDGAIDCKDSDCAKNSACAALAKETNCTNKLDDDKDGAVDCGDLDCAANAACKVTCDICQPIEDTLKTGCDPCVALVCKADAYCCDTAWDDICVEQVGTVCKKQCAGPSTELACNDKVDDDKDGLVDCADTDCAKDAACAGKETKCADKLDDDKDGMTDCADADCKVDLACQASACQDDFAINCGNTEKYNNAGSGSTKAISGYDCADGKANGETGAEYTYSYTAQCDGPVTATLVKTSTQQGFLDLFVLDAAKGCLSSACTAHALMSGSQATKTFQAKKGQKFFIVVDGYQGFSGDYSLKIACGCAGGKETACADKADNDGDGAIDCVDSDCAAELACAPTVETSCADKIDNDKDGKLDCADSDCALNLVCQATPTEQNCADKLDNDKDGKTDCADADCLAAVACAPAATETQCADKLDDDKDGKTDCADSDCAKNPSCIVATTETVCNDKVDNDKDGKLDCQDTDCAKDLACASTSTELLCGDKLDNDKDGLIDCADPDCSGLGACACKADYDLTCNDSDSWTSNGVGSTKAVSTYVCTDGTVGNETGSEYTYNHVAECNGELTVTLTKTATAQGYLDLFILDGGQLCGSKACIGHTLMTNNVATKTVTVKAGQKLNIVVDGYQGFQGGYSVKTVCKCAVVPKVEDKCGNKVDDDQDGKTDCSDADCAKDAACTPAVESKCEDKLDDDKDGKTDCADSDCATFPACAGPGVEILCADKQDNDKDGKTDCADSDCAANVVCLPKTETKCSDKLDDDKDGKTDCADADCAKDPACIAPAKESNCTDKLDDDKDGKTDCADSDCAANAACQTSAVCKPDYAMTCGDSDTYTSNGAGSTKAISTYQCADGQMSGETGSEYTYDYVATCDGTVTATLTKTASTSGFLDLFVLDGAKVCAGNSCLVHSLMSGTTATVKWTAKKGAKYNVVVDGYNGYSAGYTLKIACACAAPTTETNCTDKLDDDKDGKTDCADSDCAKNAACQVSANICKPDYELACGGSDFYNNGGPGSTKLISTWACADGTATSYAGPEYTYTYVATCTGTATATVTRSTATGTGYLDLFILDGAKACGPASCTSHALMIDDTATKSFAVTSGKTYYVVVDGYEGAVDDYQIDLDCTCK